MKAANNPSIGARRAVTPVAMEDPTTKVQYTRYDFGAGDAQVFYYSSEALSADHRYLPCWSDVSGSWQIQVIDRKENISIQLSAQDNWNSDGPVHDIWRGRVYYLNGDRLCWTNYLTLESDWLYEAPKGFYAHALSMNQEYLVVGVHEQLALGATRSGKPIGPSRPNLYYHPRSLIMAIHLDTGDADYAWGGHGYLTHPRMNRLNNDYLVYADQSAKNWQMELFTVIRPLVDDKQPQRVFHSIPGGINYVGHHWLTLDGYVACQMSEYLGVDPLNRYTDRCHYHAIARPDGTGYRRARFPGREKPLHSHGQHIDKLWVGDSWIRPDGAADLGWLCVMRNRWESMEMDIWPFIQTNHHHQRPFHVHPWISPDESEIVYAATYQGRNHIFVAEVPEKFHSQNRS